MDFTNAPLQARVPQFPRPEPLPISPAKLRVLEVFLAEIHRRLTPFVVPVGQEVRW